MSMYTVEQIREMRPGLELDDLVRKLTASVPLDPSYENSDAWGALINFCEIHKAHWALNSADTNGNYSCDIYRNDDTKHCHYEIGSTAALAICRAIVLAAMRWGVLK